MIANQKKCKFIRNLKTEGLPKRWIKLLLFIFWIGASSGQATNPLSIPGTPGDWPGDGYAYYSKSKALEDTNKTGIPDKWEISRGLKLATSHATCHDLDPQYDNIEVYMNSL